MPKSSLPLLYFFHQKTLFSFLSFLFHIQTLLPILLSLSEFLLRILSLLCIHSLLDLFGLLKDSIFEQLKVVGCFDFGSFRRIEVWIHHRKTILAHLSTNKMEVEESRAYLDVLFSCLYQLMLWYNTIAIMTLKFLIYFVAPFGCVWLLAYSGLFPF